MARAECHHQRRRCGAGVLRQTGGATFNLNKLTIANGHVADNSGGGIQNVGTLPVTNCTFLDNSTEDYGGGISNTGRATVSNSTFSGNSAYDGGGICNTGRTTVSNSTFVGNSAAAPAARSSMMISVFTIKAC